MQFKLDFGVLFFCVLSEYTSCREPLILILSYLPDGWGLVNQDYSGGLWLWSLNWPFFPVNYLNFISLVLLFFCHPARLVLQLNHELFENDLWPTANPKSLHFSQADVLLLCLGSQWLKLCVSLSTWPLCIWIWHPSSTLPVSWLATILQWLTSCSTPILQHWLQEDKLFIQYLKGFLSHTSTHTLSCQCIGYTTIQLHHFWPSEQLSFIIDSTKYWMLCVLLLCKKNNLENCTTLNSHWTYQRSKDA